MIKVLGFKNNKIWAVVLCLIVCAGAVIGCAEASAEKSSETDASGELSTESSAELSEPGESAGIALLESNVYFQSFEFTGRFDSKLYDSKSFYNRAEIFESAEELNGFIDEYDIRNPLSDYSGEGARLSLDIDFEKYIVALCFDFDNKKTQSDEPIMIIDGTTLNIYRIRAEGEEEENLCMRGYAVLLDRESLSEYGIDTANIYYNQMKYIEGYGYAHIMRTLSGERYEAEEYTDITPDEVREKTGVIIRKSATQFTTVFEVDGELYEPYICFGGFGVVDTELSEIDGNYYLISTYSWGSGLHRSHIGVFDIKNRCVLFSSEAFLMHDMTLTKISETEYEVFKVGDTASNSTEKLGILRANGLLWELEILEGKSEPAASDAEAVEKIDTLRAVELNS